MAHGIKQKSRKELSLRAEFTFWETQVKWQVRGHRTERGVIRIKRRNKAVY